MYTPTPDEQAQIMQTMGLQGSGSTGAPVSQNAFINKLISQNSAAQTGRGPGVPTQQQWEAQSQAARTKAAETAISTLPKPSEFGYKWGTTAAQAGQAAEQQMKSAYEQAQQATGVSGKTAAGMGMLAGGINWLMSPLAPLFTGINKGVEAVAGAVSDIPAVQKFAMSPTGEATQKAAQFTQDLSTVMGATAPIKSLTGGIPKTETPLTAGPGLKRIGTEPTVETPVGTEMPRTTAAEPNKQAIVQNYSRAVKPSVSGKTGPGQMAKFENDVVDAGKSIFDNKANLKFSDEYGDVQSGRLPQTRRELADATNQTKESIWSTVNDIATKQGKAGVTADTTPILSELDRISKDEALSMVNPDAQKYAAQAMELFRNPDGTPKQVNALVAQDVIKGYNAELEAFYKNPVHTEVSRMAIDAKIVYEFRRALEEAMGKVEGPEYAALKRQYGALSALERDINKAALVELKETKQGGPVGAIVNILSGGDVLTGLTTLNPATIKMGMMRLAANKMYNWYYSPERAISNMFSEYEKGNPKVPKAAPPINK